MSAGPDPQAGKPGVRNRPPGPSEPAAYLRDPNYYRLGHQLLALRANAAAEWRWAHLELPRASRVRRRHDPPERDADRKQAIKDGLKDGQRLLAQIEQTLAWIGRRQERWSAARDVQALRLQRFLAGTVSPCVELAVAGLRLEDGDLRAPASTLEHLLQQGPQAAGSRTGVRRRLRSEPIPWGSRALYNLACLGAVAHHQGALLPRRAPATLHAGTGLPYEPPYGEPDGERVDVAIWALSQALALVHGDQLAGLLRWARRDPTLGLLAGSEVQRDFERLLARYDDPLLQDDEDDELDDEPLWRRPDVLEQAPGRELLFGHLTRFEVEAFNTAAERGEWGAALADRVLRYAAVRRIASPERVLPLDDPSAWMVLRELVEALDWPGGSGA